jgi:hypothetical protein
MAELTNDEKQLLVSMIDTQIEVNKAYMVKYQVTPELIDEQHMLNDIKAKLQ